MNSLNSGLQQDPKHISYKEALALAQSMFSQDLYQSERFEYVWSEAGNKWIASLPHSDFSFQSEGLERDPSLPHRHWKVYKGWDYLHCQVQDVNLTAGVTWAYQDYVRTAILKALEVDVK